MFFNWIIFVDRGASQNTGPVSANAQNLPCASPVLTMYIIILPYFISRIEINTNVNFHVLTIKTSYLSKYLSYFVDFTYRKLRLIR